METLPFYMASSWTSLQLFQFFAPKIGIAIFCGGLIGLERELKNKAAGMKTNILICVGATLYTAISLIISTAFAQDGFYGDPARLAAQIIPGIGFLGGGAIIQSRGTVFGLTTAASIWMVAAIGVAIGIGRADVGVAVSITVVLVIVLTNFFENRILGRSVEFLVDISVEDPDGQVREFINRTLADNDLVLEDFEAVDRSGTTVLALRYSGRRSDHKKFILELWTKKGIKEVKQKG